MLIFMLLVCSSITCIAALEQQTMPNPESVLSEYEKLIGSYTNIAIDALSSEKSTKSVQYPSDYAGAYYGDDGYLHINITSSLDKIDKYTDIVDSEVTKFHVVDFTYDYLLGIHDVIKPYMETYCIFEVSTIQAANKTYIYTSNSYYIDEIASLLSNNLIIPESYEIITEENKIVQASGSVTNDPEPASISSTSYFRPGDVVYNWSNGYPITWATVLCNARKTVDGSYVYGFITAAHLWWDCTSAGNSSISMATKTQSTIDYNVDATFIPFNNSSYSTTGKISNSLYSSSNYMGYYATTGTGFENYTCRAFGKTSGEHDDVTVICCNTTYSIKDENTNITYEITGIKTSGYSSAGDSGGPVVYDNSHSNYTLLGMTSARQTSGDMYNYIVPVSSIFAELDVTMMGGNH